jgi:hypothetical protein
MSDSPKPQLPRVSRKTSLRDVAPQKTFKSLFLLAALLAGVFWLIFGGMGWIASENSTSQELFARVQDGTLQSQRIAAHSWLQKLQEASFKQDQVELDSYSPNINQIGRLEAIVKDGVDKIHKRSSTEEEVRPFHIKLMEDDDVVFTSDKYYV